jgi:hypothetical protein
MRRHKILTRTLLILFIINFTLTAPVAVRGGPEVRLDEKVTRDVTAASQKRLDESGSTNVLGSDHAPPSSPDSTDNYILDPLDPLFDPLYSLYSPGSLTGWDPPSPGSPTGSRLPVGSMPVAGSLSPSTNVPGPGHAPPSSPDSTDNYMLDPLDPLFDPYTHCIARGH